MRARKRKTPGLSTWRHEEVALVQAAEDCRFGSFQPGRTKWQV
jgi:hypothetical protein